MKIDKGKLYKYISSSYVSDLKKKLIAKIESRRNISNINKELYKQELDEEIYHTAIDERCKKSMLIKFDFLVEDLAQDLLKNLSYELGFKFETSQVEITNEYKDECCALSEIQIWFPEISSWFLNIEVYYDKNDSNTLGINWVYSYHNTDSYIRAEHYDLSVDTFISYLVGINFNNIWQSMLIKKAQFIIKHPYLAEYQAMTYCDFNYEYISEKDAKRYLKRKKKEASLYERY